MTTPNPMCVYMAGLKSAHGYGNYGRVLDEIAAELGVPTIRLYRLAKPTLRSHQLNPVQAVQLDMMTKGLVPAESTHRDMTDILKASMLLMSARAGRR